MKTKIPYYFYLLFFFSLIFVGCENGPSNNEPPYEGPPKGYIISVDRAREMFDAYSQRRVPIIQKYEDSVVSGTEIFKPSRYVEYDLETIKQYIAYIEYEAAQAKVDINTLRFYLSNYPNAKNFPNGDSVKYPRRNSLFVVPTMDYEGKNVGFSIETVDGRYTAVPINRKASKNDGGQSQPEGQINEAGFFSTNTAAVQGTSSLILNDGHVTPPPASSDFGGNN